MLMVTMSNIRLENVSAKCVNILKYHRVKMIADMMTNAVDDVSNILTLLVTTH